LIYTSTPHRGLDILVNVFEKLCEEYDNLELKVHSSYEIYGLKDNQLKYEKMHLYQRLEEHPNIKNIGYVSNDELKKSLASSHIFSYPSTYRETFCLALLEAMSAGLLCVHPNYACLPETASNWTMMYDYHENKEVHEEIFYEHLKKAIDNVNDKKVQRKLKYQSKYVNHFYNWETRTQEWIDLLKSLEHLSPKFQKIFLLVIHNMRILSVNVSHDASACILNDGEIECYFKEERVTKRKRDKLSLCSIY
jgi:UDP-glucose:(glucosyl)LPS alpha-1,2-glucosyltransferase